MRHSFQWAPTVYAEGTARVLGVASVECVNCHSVMTLEEFRERRREECGGPSYSGEKWRQTIRAVMRYMRR